MTGLDLMPCLTFTPVISILVELPEGLSTQRVAVALQSVPANSPLANGKHNGVKTCASTQLRNSAGGGLCLIG